MEEFIHPENIYVDVDFEKAFFKKRVLYNKPWIMVWGKSWFINHFGRFYKQ